MKRDLPDGALAATVELLLGSGEARDEPVKLLCASLGSEQVLTVRDAQMGIRLCQFSSENLQKRGAIR